MLHWSRWTCAALLALTLLSATARADHYRTIVVAPPPVIVAPAPVVRYYTPAPEVRYYTPAPEVRYYNPEPAVTYDYAPTVVRSYYPATVVAPSVASYRYGVFGLRRLDVVNYGGAAVLPAPVVPVRSYYYTPRVIVYP